MTAPSIAAALQPHDVSAFCPGSLHGRTNGQTKKLLTFQSYLTLGNARRGAAR